MFTSVDPGAVPSISIEKNVILELCEPYIKEIQVKYRNFEFDLELFGTFDWFEEKLYYGASKYEYQARFDNPAVTKIPISFARYNGNSYYLAPAGDFSDNDLQIIRDAIEYTLQSQMTMMSYLGTHCSE